MRVGDDTSFAKHSTYNIKSMWTVQSYLKVMYNGVMSLFP
jgi:hypothetical protein